MQGCRGGGSGRFPNSYVWCLVQQFAEPVASPVVIRGSQLEELRRQMFVFGTSCKDESLRLMLLFVFFSVVAPTIHKREPDVPFAKIQGAANKDQVICHEQIHPAGWSRARTF